MIKRLEKNAGNMELIPTGDLSAFAKEIATYNDDYIRELFYSYNTYIKRIVDDTKRILEKQLEMNHTQGKPCGIFDIQALFRKYTPNFSRRRAAGY
jgi:hypothetical protein